MPPRLSRHHYDLSRLYRHDYGQLAIADVGLLASVVEHKKVFFREAGGAVRFGRAWKPSGMSSRLPSRSDSKRLPGHARDVLWRNSTVRSSNRGPERSRRPGQLLNTP